jgi:hypothetical protein
LAVKDTGGVDISRSGTFLANFMPDSPANMFLIEAEDFNLNGAAKPEVNTMPYLGAAYDGLTGALDIDYHRADAVTDGDNYRKTESPNLPMSVQNDDNGQIRAQDAAGAATWRLTANYRLGWAGDGNWQDYTRQVPTGNYQVWASMSYGESPSTAIRAIGNLKKVTSDPAKTGQTTTPIGYFRGAATGGWGANQLYPMRLTTDAAGDAAVVTLGGATTFQFEYASSDVDYFMLVPASGGGSGLTITGVTVSAGTLKITWTGGGSLQSSADLKAWTDVPSSTGGTYSTATSAAHMFYRVKN